MHTFPIGKTINHTIGKWENAQNREDHYYDSITRIELKNLKRKAFNNVIGLFTKMHVLSFRYGK